MSKKTEILAVIDRSGSMQTIRTDAEGGFARFVKEQQAVPGEARLTLVEFDNLIDTVYQAKPLADVPPYTLLPRGSTSLYDAIGKTMNQQGKRIATEAWAELVILVIVTDGGENSSHEFSDADVKRMIKHAEEKGWQVMYLGANQDAFAVGHTIGVRAQNTATYAASAAGTASAYYAMSANTTSLRNGLAPDALQNVVDKKSGGHIVLQQVKMNADGTVAVPITMVDEE